jgi:glycosyltransferase involved in cell wall biosynthesis
LSMSEYEGFPNVFLEALACGVPIITVPISHEINIMVSRSVNCRVAKSGSIEDYAEALRNWRLTARSSPRHGYERPRLPAEYLPDNVYGSLKLAFSQL